jgi:hypothetical protein
VTPVFRHSLNEKFNRGAENQAFLVESITGVQTLKALAVEPQMQRRWEEQLAGYSQLHQDLRRIFPPRNGDILPPVATAIAHQIHFRQQAAFIEADLGVRFLSSKLGRDDIGILCFGKMEDVGKCPGRIKGKNGSL